MMNNAASDILADTTPPTLASDPNNVADASEIPFFELTAKQRENRVHMRLTEVGAPERREHDEATSTSILRMAVVDHIESKRTEKERLAFPQYGLLARELDEMNPKDDNKEKFATAEDDRLIYLNISSPSSTSICGS
jgi:hypothetical protein